MANAQDMGGGKTPEIEGKMKVEEAEEMEDTGVIEKREKAGQMTAGTAEIVEVMGAQEPVATTMEERGTADQREAPEESARRLQASGSLL